MKKNSKGKTYATIAFLVVLGVLVTIGSFALWTQTRKQTNFNAIVTACLNLTIENESSEITMDYAYPVSNTEGLSSTGYSFTVTNNCSQPVNYAIAIESVNDNSGKPFVGNQYINISLDGKAPSHYSALDTITSDSSANYTIRETRSLATKRVGGNSSRTHTLRMWLDENTPLTEQNKTFVSKVTLTGGQGIEAACYTVNADGVLIDYDPECGSVAQIPASVNGHNLTTISSNAFKGAHEEPVIIYHDPWIDVPKDADTDVVSSIDDFGRLNDTCNYSNNDKCTIDFGIVYSKGLYEVTHDQTVRQQVMQENGIQSEAAFYAYLGSHYTPSDYFGVVYYDGNDSDRLEAIEDYFDAYFAQFAPYLGWQASDLHYYAKEDAPYPDGAYYEEYMKTMYNTNDGWYASENIIGTGEATGETEMVTSLVIDSLDLSNATNLVKIENRAFSNMPDLSTQEGVNALSDDICRIKPGLTSITFGNNTKEIRYGGSVFAGAKLNSLTLYTTAKLDITPVNRAGLNTLNYDGDNYDDLTLLYGILPCSTINTLNIEATSNNHTFGGLNQLYANGGINGNIQGFNIITGLQTADIGMINLDDDITEIGTGAFDNFQYTGTLTLPTSLTTIGDSAFSGYDGTTLTIPNNVTSIGANAFWRYHGTGQNLVIPASVDSIGEDAFWQYNGSTLTFNEGLHSLANGAFQHYNGASFTIPSTIQTLGTNNDSVFAFFTGTANINMTEANFNANVSHSSYWNLRGTNHFLTN